MHSATDRISGVVNTVLESFPQANLSWELQTLNYVQDTPLKVSWQNPTAWLWSFFGCSNCRYKENVVLHSVCTAVAVSNRAGFLSLKLSVKWLFLVVRYPEGNQAECRRVGCLRLRLRPNVRRCSTQVQPTFKGLSFWHRNYFFNFCTPCI